MRQAGKAMDGNPAFCDVVAQGYHFPIRKMEQETAQKALLALLPRLSEQFGGRHHIKEEVLAACVQIILKKFSHLGLKELPQAYEMYYAGELEVKGAEMYGGIFNAANMMKILAAYSRHRQKLIGQYLRLITAAETEKVEKERQHRKRQQFLAGIPEEIETRRPMIKSWRDIPVYWFEAGIELKLFERPVASGAIRKIQQDAKIAAELELRKTEESGQLKPTDDRRSAFRELDFRRQFENRLRQREVVVFMKMYTFSKLIENEEDK